ncbi:LuxR C-terminal-related transcriptional regulator [Streptosporangium algeriense]|uniref:LuxR C-terminal-related transcriptional regulator n=1 Tax=Streptosporangium algeriense TaxID=1682748 RepID=A0ABW3DXV2_9ACTN
MLTSLGLTKVAESVYRAMLTRPNEGVGELADRLSCGVDDVRAALDELSELALIRPSQQQSGLLHAVSPDIGMQILLSRQQAGLIAQQQRLEESRAAAARLIADHASLRSEAGGAGVEQIVGIDNIRDRIAVLCRTVSREIMTFAPDGAQTPENLESARPQDAAVLERGVRLRVVYLDSLRNNQPTVDYANWIVQRGAEVRTVATLPNRMIILDRGTVVIAVSSDNTAAGAVILTGEGTVTALCALFESVWANARPLASAVPVNAHGLSPQEQSALALLAEGYTDEAIAKRLGVSPRTSRRLAATLIERLGARSRFEAGVRAVRQGWLEH